MNGCFNCVDILVDAGAYVNGRDDSGRTALLCCLIEAREMPRASAAESRNFPKCVTSLIAAKADVNKGDTSGYTPLMVAAESGCSEYLVILINAGADIDRADWIYETASRKAVAKGNWECVELLKKAGADMNMDDMFKEKALAREVLKGNCDGVINLLTAGADVNSPKIKMRLILEALKGKLECVELLIKKGADVKIDDSFLSEASFLARLVGVPDFILKLMETCRDECGHYVQGNVQNKEPEHVVEVLNSYMLVQACRGGCGAIVDALVEAGADVNMVDFRTGDTPLIAAARSGSIHCMRSVLLARADVNRSDRRGCSALEVLHNISQMKNCILLPVAAGQTTSPSRYLQMKRNIFPDNDDVEEDKEQFEDLRLQLRHICREAIRKHLLELDRHTNLFKKIPQLPLPRVLTSYLLFDISVESGDDNLNNNGDETLMTMLESMQIKDNEKKTFRE